MWAARMTLGCCSVLPIFCPTEIIGLVSTILSSSSPEDEWGLPGESFSLSPSLPSSLFPAHGHYELAGTL